MEKLPIANLGRPSALTIDLETKKLYWVDETRNLVGFSDLMGNDVHTLPLTLTENPIAIIVHEDCK